ncbi:MAG: hypothetical protein ABI813_04090 [Bacteroidota bacterium]
MIIEIRDGLSLGEIGDAFSGAFPFLSYVYLKINMAEGTHLPSISNYHPLQRLLR